MTTPRSSGNICWPRSIYGREFLSSYAIDEGFRCLQHLERMHDGEKPQLDVNAGGKRHGLGLHGVGTSWANARREKGAVPRCPR